MENSWIFGGGGRWQRRTPFHNSFITSLSFWSLSRWPSLSAIHKWNIRSEVNKWNISWWALVSRAILLHGWSPEGVNIHECLEFCVCKCVPDYIEIIWVFFVLSLLLSPFIRHFFLEIKGHRLNRSLTDNVNEWLWRKWRLSQTGGASLCGVLLITVI